MKKVILIILVCIGSKCIGQARMKLNDTLEIKYYPEIKFIKFGQRIYEVSPPLLKEVTSIYLTDNLFVVPDTLLQPTPYFKLNGSAIITTELNEVIPNTINPK